MEKKINLEEILNEEARKAGYSNFVHCFVEQDCTEEVTKQAMKEACRQVLELAAENAEAELEFKGILNSVDKQSILDTINQVE